MRRQYVFIILFFLCRTVNTSAQSESSLSTIIQSLDSVFENLYDTSKVKSGYLRDKAIDLVRLSAYTGQELTDSNYVDAFLYRDLIRTMNYASVSASVQRYNADSLFLSLTTSESGHVKLRTALFKYHFIKNGAVANGLIDYNQATNKVSYKYNGDVWQNPFDSTLVFMFAIGESYVESSYVHFDLSGILPIGNSAYYGLLIDFDDGQGFVSANNKQTYSISYSYPGVKNLKAKIILPDNTELNSHSLLTVGQANVAQLTETETIVEPDVSDTLTSNGIRAVYNIKYHPNHGGVIKKPFIYVEGFDHPVLAELMHFNVHTFDNVINDHCQGNYNFYSTYKGDIKAFLLEKQYDFVYVDWLNPEADIIQNAELLKAVISLVNNLRPTDGSDKRGTLVGHSMGGLVGRWALRDMELNNQEHRISCFVTQDSPHCGAVVPIGIQYAVRDIYCGLFGSDGNGGLSGINDLKTFMDKIVGVLDCTSARQMMYNYIDASLTLNNQVHEEWQDSLTIKGFPRGDQGYSIENLAIVSGGDLGNTELSKSIISTNLSLTDYPSLRHPFSFNNLFCSLFVDRDRGAGSLVSRTIISYAHISDVPIPLFYFVSRNHTSPAHAGHYDMVYGSFLGANDFPNLVIPLPQFFLSLFGNAKIVFVPTASALSVDNYNLNFLTYQPGSIAGCPFDSYCLEHDAMRHDNSLYAYLDWIHDHSFMSIIGSNDFVLTGDSYYTINPPQSVPLYWGSSDETVATVNSSGVITVSNYKSDCIDVYRFGSIDKAWSYNNHSSIHSQRRYYRKRRTVLAGFPDMNLNAVHQSGNDYSVTATCVSSDSELRSYVDTLAARGVLRYIWGIKNSDNTYTWSDTTSTRSFAYTVQPNSLVHVCMKLCDSLGRVSTTINDVEIDRRSTVKYLYEPDIMTVTSLGSIYHYQYLSGTTMLNNHYFCTWKNPDYSPAPAAPDNITVKGDYIPLKTSYYTNVAGVNTTVYCFEFLQSSELQDAIDEVLSDSSIRCAFIPIQIRNGTTVLQDVMFYVEKPTLVPDLPQPPH